MKTIDPSTNRALARPFQSHQWSAESRQVRALVHLRRRLRSQRVGVPSLRENTLENRYRREDRIGISRRRSAKKSMKSAIRRGAIPAAVPTRGQGAATLCPIISRQVQLTPRESRKDCILNVYLAVGSRVGRFARQGLRIRQPRRPRRHQRRTPRRRTTRPGFCCEQATCRGLA